MYHQKNHSVPSSEEYSKRQCELHNSIPGKLPGYDCPICKNKGVIYFMDGDYEVTRPCSCMEIRNSIMRLRHSGLQSLLNLNTFDNFKTDTSFQKNMKSMAQNYLNDYSGRWFFAGGQSGSGKTHICTALAGELLKRGIAIRYMLWCNESTQMKAATTDSDEYLRLIEPLRQVPALYIDDLFKPVLDEYGKRKRPTPGDIKLAFDIINSRYVHPNLITVISSEWNIDELQDIDAAIGGRIYERAKGFCISISPDSDKNYRLR